MELALVDAVRGPKGCEMRIKQALLNFTPTSDANKEPHQAQAAVTAWISKDAYKYATTAVKSKADVFKKWLGRIAGDRAPEHELASQDDMLAEVVSCFQHCGQTRRTRSRLFM